MHCMLKLFRGVKFHKNLSYTRLFLIEKYFPLNRNLQIKITRLSESIQRAYRR